MRQYVMLAAPEGKKRIPLTDSWPVSFVIAQILIVVDFKSNPQIFAGFIWRSEGFSFGQSILEPIVPRKCRKFNPVHCKYYFFFS